MTGGLLFAPKTARELAYRVLERYRLTGCFVQDELATEFASGAWPPTDRRFITELVCGVVRRQLALTEILRPAISRPWDRIEPELVTLLWLGAYQLAYLDRVPAFAAIHETVEIARSLGQLRWTGFANGILRTISRVVDPNPIDQPAANALPIGQGRYRRIQADIFPDPAVDLPGYVSLAYSLPMWLVERWAKVFDHDQLLSLAEAVNSVPALYVRINRRRISVSDLQQRWQAEGIVSEIVPGLDALRVHEAGNIEELPGYAEGWFAPQDLTAMQAAIRLAPDPDDRVWDMCAAPGTKTCHLAELRDDHGSLLATDVHAERLAFVLSGADRLGLTSIQTAVISSELYDLPRGPFEAILVDAPCSNTGVLHRRPEARWRLLPQDFEELPAIQQGLLKAAVQRLSPGGRVLYSTCSIERDENQAVIARVMAQTPDLQLVDEALFLPGPQGDGGYQALLVRNKP
ncbi:hypothetical protein GC163_09390 [bacterium]|nr:hypothetical protein [bacterium]